ncbi:hypothetical protein [Azospirillum brasilense]|uniref:hypothetical protein n=1 Tax=Azospirillum brasilense TaxID=192 RepID=UPI0013B3E8E1|nr:hypothetical protein [Azospirillum brasilense]
MSATDRIRSASELLCNADEVAQAVPKALEQSIRLYYVSRYLVAVFEARFGQLPLQVWNEYRNALDHFFRHVTAAQGRDIFSSEEQGHLRKMEGHIQRAVLDICKFFCVRNRIHIDEQILAYGKNVLELVDHGTFYSGVLSDRQAALRAAEAAKIADSALGEDARTNSEIVSRYVNAVFCFEKIIISFEDHQKAIGQCQQLVAAQERRFGFKSVFVGLLINLLSAFVGYIVALIMPVDVTNWFSHVAKWVSGAL